MIIGKYANYQKVFLYLHLKYLKWRQHNKSAIKVMIQARFVDDSTIEVIAQDGEKFIWNTYFPTPKQNQQYFAGRFEYYYQKHSEDNIDMGLGYWVSIKMNYD